MRLKIYSKLISVLSITLLLTACGGGDNTTDSENKEISISGAVQKGPFIVGTPVYVNKLDNQGNASDSTVITEVKDSIGSFSFDIQGSGPVQIVSTGYYFSELTGQISSGTLTLKAIYDASSENEQEAFVNILTHLTNNRVLNIINKENIKISEAIKRAKTELISEFSTILPVSNISDFSSLSVYNKSQGDDFGNAYLLALSTMFYRYAEIEAEGENTSSDAQLALILNQVANDFEDDGKIQQDGLIANLTSALRQLNPREITDNLKRRSSVDLSEPLDVPDITRFFGLCAGEAECMWSARSPMPIATRGHASAVYKNKIYIFGGASDVQADNPDVTEYTDVFAYDIETNQWEQKQPMPIGLYDLTAHTIGGKIYIFGGYGNGGFINSVMEFDPENNSWLQKSPMPTYRYTFMSAEVEGKVYVIGGQGTIDNGPWESGKPWEDKNHVEIYDPETNSWSNGNSAPIEISGGTSCTMSDDIYIFGGYIDGKSTSDTYVYNVTNDLWTKRTPSLLARNGHTCVSVGSDFYLMGGRNSQSSLLDSVEMYSFEKDIWRQVSYLPTARYWLSSNAVGSYIYTLGGVDGESGIQVSTVEVLNTSLIE